MGYYCSTNRRVSRKHLFVPESGFDASIAVSSPAAVTVTGGVHPLGVLAHEAIRSSPHSASHHNQRNTLTMRIVLLSFAIAACLHASAIADDSPQASQRLDVTVKVGMDYLLALPRNYDQQDSWPLVLFLHGAGERGDDLELVKQHGPPKLISEGKDFPFIVVSPQCPKDLWWEPIELTALLDQIVKTHKVDEDRVYVTGLSMGGFGTWRLAAFTPDRFAAIAPICGGGEPYWARRFSHLPTWAFHGAKDQAVPLERSQKMIDAMKEKGGEPKLTVYPEAGHDSWTETYNNPEFYEWLLEQKRSPAKQ